jgi:lipopolysaccharide transport system ATP-binding protein
LSPGRASGGFKKQEKGLPMSSDNTAIRVSNLGKCYQIYNAPRDRLKQFVMPRLQRLTKFPQQSYFREFWALKDVSFEVRKGESVGIIGRNGSGKSTLLQMIAGTLSPTLGKVEITGRVAALLELGSGFNADFTGRENVFMNAAVLGLSRKEITSRFTEIAAFANIGDFIEQPVKMYSSGMIVRLAFAVSVCVQPDILIVDEALAVGDMAFQFKCLERLHELIENGTTLLFVSHDINLVRSFCDQALLLDHGQTAVFGPSLEVTETYLMHARQEQMASSNDRIVTIKPRVATDSRFAFGSEQGQIVNVVFADTQSTKAFFSTGDIACVTIDVEYSQSLNFPCVSLIILDQRMVVLAGRYFPLNKSKPQDHICRHQLTCKFQIPLAPGEYFITIRLEERMSEHLQILVDKLVGALSFDVIGKEKIPSWGVLDIDIDFLDNGSVS